MSEYEGEFLKIIKLLSDNDLLDHVVVVGSWSEFLYQRTGLIPPNTTALRTLDVDILVRNLRKPNPPVNHGLRMNSIYSHIIYVTIEKHV
jgi:hypothetical protein